MQMQATIYKTPIIKTIMYRQRQANYNRYTINDLNKQMANNFDV